jgi:FlaA1/EpsC-like NDP-sugar epimerase
MAVVDKVQTESSIRHVQGRVPSQNWSGSYRRVAKWLDVLSMLMAGVIAFVLRFPGVPTELNAPYVALTVILPVVWLPTLMLCRAYQPKYIGVGYEEFHRVIRAGFILTATVAILAYATKTEVARGYVVMALPLGTFLALLARYRLRKWLHKKRWTGQCMRRVVAVGHRTSVADLIRLLRKKRYHGMDIVAVCLPPALAAGDDAVAEVEGVPVLGDFAQAASVAERIGADSVAVLACPETDGWDCAGWRDRLSPATSNWWFAPALMDVTSPWHSVRPVSGLPLLHVEHPELTGGRKVLKALFDRVAALTGIVALSPLLLVVMLLIKMRAR